MQVEITVIKDGNETDAEITGFFGSFGFGDGLGVAQLIGSKSPHLDHVIKVVDADSDGIWTVQAEVVYVEPETQYGTGEGDILTLPGYFMVGEILGFKKHCIESTESPSPEGAEAV